MRLDSAEVRVVDLAMVAPFRTPFGTIESREVVLVVLTIGGRSYYGECASLHAPIYSPDYTQGVSDVLTRHLIPSMAGSCPEEPRQLSRVLDSFVGHQMAKSGLVGAWSAWYADQRGTCLSELIGGTRTSVECGISIGIPPSIDALIGNVVQAMETGFRRVKLKVMPGWSAEPVAAVRAHFPGIRITVDGNGSFDAADLDELAALERYDLLFVEQPFPEDDLVLHARLQARMETPICLDESIISAGDVDTALGLDACRVVNIKVGRVGGIWNAKAIHDRCLEDGIPVWCGGLMETGIGQSESLALASLPGCVFPADIGPSERYFRDDIVYVGPMEDGNIAVPTKVMDDRVVRTDVLDQATTFRLLIEQ